MGVDGADNVFSWKRFVDLFLLGLVTVASTFLVDGDQVSGKSQVLGAAKVNEPSNLEPPIPRQPNFSVSSVGGRLVKIHQELKKETSAEEMVWGDRDWSFDTELVRSLTACLKPWHGDLSGGWTKTDDLVGSRLDIEETEEGTWAVTFGAWGCVMEWTLERSGVKYGDVLQLDGPVRTYRPGEPFSVLFLAEIESRPVLVPSTYAVILNRLAESEGCQSLSFAEVGGGVYVRVGNSDF